MLADENAKEYEEAARERQEASRAKPGEKIGSNVPQNVVEPDDDDPNAGMAITQAGKAFGVSREYVRQARDLTAGLTGPPRGGQVERDDAEGRKTPDGETGRVL